MNKRIAMYLRISRDDDDRGDESNSISNQRGIINNYISSSNEFYGMSVSEFVDDGYSGTSFDRPGIKQLLEAVRRGEISCVIVKDLSRLGRAYLEVSKYIEVIFPYLNVRFIAVNDRYDSSSHRGTTADIDVVFRNLINEIYSKDISTKVKTAKQTKARQGKNTNAFTPYGYKKSKADKHRLEIDEPAAQTVKRIFDMFCEGHTPAQIAKTLNTEGVLTPSEYKKKNGSNLKVLSTTGSIWSNGTVNNILHNEQYLGTLICGKTELGGIGSKKIVYKPKSDWIKTPNAHPAIITSEIWDAVYLKKSQVNYSKRRNSNIDRLLYKKVRCGYCGHIMRYRSETKKTGEGEYRYYYCETSRFTDEYGCTSKAYISLEIEDIVKSVVKTQITAMFDMEKICRKAKMALNKSIETLKKSANRIDDEIDRLDPLKQQIYESYKLGELDKDEHMKQREEVEAKITSKKQERDALLSESEKQSDEINKAYQLFKYLSECKIGADPPAKIINALIETVRVFDMERIEVKLKYRDELEQVQTNIAKWKHMRLI